jgi:hypothetical protein
MLYERILNYITNRSFLTHTFNSQVPNDKDYRDTFGYKRNSHRGKNVLCIIMSFLMPIFIEMLSAVRFASQQLQNESTYLIAIVISYIVLRNDNTART